MRNISSIYVKELYQENRAPTNSFVSIEKVTRTISQQVELNAKTFALTCTDLNATVDDMDATIQICPAYYNSVDLFRILRHCTFFYDFIERMDEPNDHLYADVYQYFLPDLEQEKIGSNFSSEVDGIINLSKELIGNIRKFFSLKRADIHAVMEKLTAVQQIIQRQIEQNKSQMKQYLSRASKNIIEPLNKFPVNLLLKDINFKIWVDFIYDPEEQFVSKDDLMKGLLADIKLQVITETEFNNVIDAGFTQIETLVNTLREQIRKFILSIFYVESFTILQQLKQALKTQRIQNQTTFVAHFQHESQPLEANEQVVHICPTYYNKINLFDKLEKKEFLTFYSIINFIDKDENIFRELLLGKFLQLFQGYDEELIKALQKQVELEIDTCVNDIVLSLKDLIGTIRNKFAGILTQSLCTINARLDLVLKEMRAQIKINQNLVKLIFETASENRYKFVLPRTLCENNLYVVLFDFITFDEPELSCFSLLANLLECSLNAKQFAELCTVEIIEKLREVENCAQVLKEQLKSAMLASPSIGFQESVVRFFSPKSGRRNAPSGTGSINGEASAATREERSMTIEFN